MKYDPVKSRLGKIVSRSVWLRKIFYTLLDILLLRTWHVKRALRKYALKGICHAPAKVFSPLDLHHPGRKHRRMG